MDARSHAPVPVEARLHIKIPLVGSTVAAGFPSPADEYLDKPLDFNELLIENPQATFAVRVVGDSKVGAGIFPGDIAIVDRSKEARDGSIILGIVDGEFTIKRLRQRNGGQWLEAENSGYKRIEITDGMDFQVWGCIRNSIRML